MDNIIFFSRECSRRIDCSHVAAHRLSENLIRPHHAHIFMRSLFFLIPFAHVIYLFDSIELECRLC